LRELRDRYGDRGFLAAYNAGPARYEEHLATGRPLPSETLAYMAAVALRTSARFGDGGDDAEAVASSWRSASLFVARTPSGFVPFRPSDSASTPQRRAAGTEASRPAFAPPSDGLFAPASGRNARP
jgi:hypothetical protein